MVEGVDNRPTEYSGSPEAGWVGRRPIGEGAYVVFTYGVPNSGGERVREIMEDAVGSTSDTGSIDSSTSPNTSSA